VSAWERHRLSIAFQDERSQNPESGYARGHGPSLQADCRYFGCFGRMERPGPTMHRW
jgi:hypothetical protein